VGGGSGRPGRTPKGQGESHACPVVGLDEKGMKKTCSPALGHKEVRIFAESIAKRKEESSALLDKAQGAMLDQGAI